MCVYLDCKRTLLNDTEQIMNFECIKFLILASFFIDLCPKKTTAHQMKDLYETTNLKTILLKALKNLKHEV